MTFLLFSLIMYFKTSRNLVCVRKPDAEFFKSSFQLTEPRLIYMSSLTVTTAAVYNVPLTNRKFNFESVSLCISL